MVDWSIEREISRDTWEHEVLISFNDDEDAYKFQEWWERDGHVLFETFLKEPR